MWNSARSSRRCWPRAATARVEFRLTRDDLRRPGLFDPAGGDLSRAAARTLGFEPVDVDTLPGHDAITLAALCPSLMLTVPSRDGLCHHPDEWTAPENLELGVEWLQVVLTRLAAEGVP